MSDTPLNTSDLVRPSSILDGIAASTWEAYNAMQTTKQRHYDLLQVLENKKKKFNIDPTEKDRALLTNLLSDHDAQVKRFTEASQALKATDADAHHALFVYIGQVASLTSSGETHH
jgi:hypothetical protein